MTLSLVQLTQQILMTFSNLYTISIFNDAPLDSAAPAFTGLVSLHNTIGFYLIIISLAMFWVFFYIFFYASHNLNLSKTNNSIINYLLVLSCKLYNSTQIKIFSLVAIIIIICTVLFYWIFNEYFIIILPKITMENLIKIIIENTSQISNCNLNSF